MTERRFVILDEDKDRTDCILDTVSGGNHLSFMDLLDCANSMQKEIQEYRFENNMLILENQKLRVNNWIKDIEVLLDCIIKRKYAMTNKERTAYNELRDFINRINEGGD